MQIQIYWGDNEGLVENKENKYDTQTIVDTSALMLQ